MLSIQSPHSNIHHSMNTSSKPDLLISNISPTFRNKRIPSAHDSYSYSSNHNLKVFKVESPSKFSQKLKRRKSQYINTNSYLDSQPVVQKKKSSKSINQNTSNPTNQMSLNHMQKQPFPPTNNPQIIINQMNFLKDEYKQLKLAFKQLIEQKINNAQKMNQIKEENRKLQSELQMALGANTIKNSANSTNIALGNKLTSKSCRQKPLFLAPTLEQYEEVKNQNKKLKQKNSFYENELQRIKKECYKILQAEKFKSKKLQDALQEKNEIVKQLKQQVLCQQNRKNQYSSCRTNLNKMLPNQMSNINSSSKMPLFSKQQGKSSTTPKMAGRYAQEHHKNPINLQIPKLNYEEQSLFISQDKTLDHQSQFISISLTSVIQESQCNVNRENMFDRIGKPNEFKNRQPLIQIHLNQFQSSETVLNKQVSYKWQQISSKREKLAQRYDDSMAQNVKNGICNPKNDKERQEAAKGRQGANNIIKKMRKQVHQKLQINLNHFQNKKEGFFNLKTPINNPSQKDGVDKKMLSKKKNSKTKRKEQDKENNSNYHVKEETNPTKNIKKKQKNQSYTCK